jgi:hypothetical protein
MQIKVYEALTAAGVDHAKAEIAVEAIEDHINMKIRNYTLEAMQPILAQLTRMEGRFDNLDVRFDSLEQKLSAKIEGVEQKLTAKIEGVEQKLKTQIETSQKLVITRIDGREWAFGRMFQLILIAGALLASVVSLIAISRSLGI